MAYVASSAITGFFDDVKEMNCSDPDTNATIITLAEGLGGVSSKNLTATIMTIIVFLLELCLWWRSREYERKVGLSVLGAPVAAAGGGAPGGGGVGGKGGAGGAGAGAPGGLTKGGDKMMVCCGVAMKCVCLNAIAAIPCCFFLAWFLLDPEGVGDAVEMAAEVGGDAAEMAAEVGGDAAEAVADVDWQVSIRFSSLPADTAGIALHRIPVPLYTQTHLWTRRVR